MKELSEEKGKSKTVRNAVIVSVVIISVIVAALILMNLNKIIPPDVDVISYSASDGLEGLDYVVYVHATVFNHGGEGQVTIWAQVEQGGHTWKKTQTIWLGSKESKDLTFKFKEVAFWTLESCYYLVWIG